MGLEEEKIYYQSQNLTLCAIVNRVTQSQAVGNVLLVHGIITDKDEHGNFVKLANKLHAKFYNVMRFDFRGHGESQGRSEDVTIAGECNDLIASVEHFDELTGANSKYIIVASSFGAIASILYVSTHRDKITKLVLWNPVLDLEKTFLKAETPWGKTFFNEGGYRELHAKGYISVPETPFRFGRELIEEFGHIKPFELLGTFDMPVLTIHGSQDTEVPYSVSKQYGTPNNRSQFISLGCGHSFVGVEDIVIDETVSWVFIEAVQKPASFEKVPFLKFLDSLFINDKAGNLPFLIGICGRSCCGKGMVANAIASVNRNVLHINMDSFFKVKSPAQYKGYDNWDCVEALRFDSLIEVVKKLRKGKSARVPSRGWTEKFDVEIYSEELEKRNLILVEGFLLFAVEELADLFDSKIFIDVSDVNLLYRRLHQDNSMQRINFIYDVVIPMSKNYEDKQKANADIIFDGNAGKDKIITDVSEYINDTLSRRGIEDPPDFSPKQPPWKVYFGDLLTDHAWHPIDFDNLKDWVQERRNDLESGQELIGNTFRYRKHIDSGIYEVRLDTRNIYRYDRKPSPRD